MNIQMLKRILGLYITSSKLYSRLPIVSEDGFTGDITGDLTGNINSVASTGEVAAGAIGTGPAPVVARRTENGVIITETKIRPKL